MRITFSERGCPLLLPLPDGTLWAGANRGIADELCIPLLFPLDA